MIRGSFLFALVTLVAATPAVAQSPLEDKFFDSDGVRLHYVEAGSGDTVVLIHGFTVSLQQQWVSTGIIDVLSKDFHVVALDCRGHGESDKPHDPASYGLRMVEDVTRLLDHLGVDRAHIAGYSMGGRITGKFAATHPDRVLTAVFGGASALAWTAERQRVFDETAVSLERGDGLRPMILALLPPNEPRPSEEEIEELSSRALGSNDPLALAAVLRVPPEQGTALTDDEIRALSMPLLAVIGGADPIKADVDAFKLRKPELKVVVIEGAAHVGARAATRRQEFAEATRNFLIEHQH